MFGTNKLKAPRHAPTDHATGVTIKGFVFLYCPVGNIFSWSAGDVEHKYCHYCKKFFDEMLPVQKKTVPFPEIKVDPSLPANKVRFDHPDGRSEEIDLS